MKYDSKSLRKAMQPFARPGRAWIILFGLSALIGACLTTRTAKPALRPIQNRGIHFTHANHIKRGLDCTMCHTPVSPNSPDYTIPNHDVCSACHNIPADYKTTKDTKSCSRCHTRPDHSVTPRIKILPEERNFSHIPHIKAKIACTTCHANPDKETLPAGSLMTFCLNCHEKQKDAAHLTQCTTCHKIWGRGRASLLEYAAKYGYEVKGAKHKKAAKAAKKAEGKKATKAKAAPSSKTATKATGAKSSEAYPPPDPELVSIVVSHFPSQYWYRVHGQQAKSHPEYCAQCHRQDSPLALNVPIEPRQETEPSCEECHRKTPPPSHTPVWRRKTHGLQASWDRQKCSVCHEEDFCLKCHENTKPESHRGGWGFPMNLHCVSCHFPPEQTKCTVCHEEVDHRGAMHSPHDLGIYPVGKCGLCHPGSIPTQAPHIMNSTTQCFYCHK